MYRVLHFMADIQVGSGMAAVVMNYYRHVDRSRVQFDFLYFRDGPQSYEQEIRSLGGRVFRIPRPSPLSMGAIHDFFRQHRGEFRVLHCHPICPRPCWGRWPSGMASGPLCCTVTAKSPANPPPASCATGCFCGCPPDAPMSAWPAPMRRRPR